MSNVLNPETESITLNTELETPILEPATEKEQPSYESTSNPETAANPEAIAPACWTPMSPPNPLLAAQVAEATPEASAEAAEIPASVRARCRGRSCAR